MRRKLLTLLMTGAILCSSLAGCSSVESRTEKVLSSEDAKTELQTLLTKVTVSEVKDPAIDISTEEASEKDTLADISTFPIVLQGNGAINLEIAAPSEFAGEAPDDWLIKMGERFNRENVEINGQTVNVSIRKMSSGEAVTYINAGAYKPDLYIPSNEALGKMLEASGIHTEVLTNRLAGNTAGLLLKKDIAQQVKEEYGSIDVEKVLTAANEGKLTFAYTNPYTSATGLNILTAMLAAFDKNDPLSQKAQDALLEYQKSAPPVAYTTGVLRESARKGVVNAMVMEEQAYINTPELKGYDYTPAGIRHDHPVYAFDWTKDLDAARTFVEYCLTEEAQKLATEKGFNRTDDYEGQDPGLSGTEYMSAQQVWKQNKTGGKPIVAVFVTDVSGSMDGEPINALKNSLVKSSIYIGQEHYIGLVSYSSDVVVNLPIAQFDAMQRAKFAGEVKGLSASGGTATYDAVLVATKMIEEAMEDLPDAKPLLFVLTDGEQNAGYTLNRVTGIIGGLQIPVYTIAYNYNNIDDLERLSNINEAASIRADSDDIVNQLRNLFNVNM